VLLDPVRWRALAGHVWPEYKQVVAVADDEVLAVTPTDELVRVSLPDGAVMTEATNVRELDASDDHAWLAWQDLAVTDGDDPEWPVGAVYVRDRATGTTTHLADTTLGSSHGQVFSFMDAGVIRLRTGGIASEPERLWMLPSFSTFDLPVGESALLRLDDGRWVVENLFDGPFWLVDPTTGERTSLFDRSGLRLVEEDGLLVRANATCCTGDYWRQEAELWRAPWDSEPELLAPRTGSSYGFLPDGAVLTTLDVNEERLGTMVVVDPTTHDERSLDDRVLPGWKEIEADGAIVYAVMDEERSGVWLTKLADGS
jgi:hypothetical protein